jgi:hypothetical protein
MMVAIDFTSSNEYLRSLHRMDNKRGPGKLNQYEQAIKAIGDIIESYDSDKVYPLYGFGALLPEGNGKFSQVNFCFPLPVNGEPEVQGVEGILQAYDTAMPTLYFSCPTFVAEIIDKATEYAANTVCNQVSQKYNVLVILTDGAIDDMQEAQTAIIKVQTFLFLLNMKVNSLICCCDRLPSIHCLSSSSALEMATLARCIVWMATSACYQLMA